MLNNQMAQRIPEGTPKMARPNTSPCKIHNHGFKVHISYKWGIGSSPIPGPCDRHTHISRDVGSQIWTLGTAVRSEFDLEVGWGSNKNGMEALNHFKHLNYGEILVTWFDHGN
jgi:hypothetical protein